MKLSIVLMVVSHLLMTSLASTTKEPPSHWRQDARKDIERANGLKKNYGKAKNIVLAIGDGMGLPTLTAARIYKGQKKNMFGEEYKLVFEDFPNVALSKTYNLDRQVADSSGAATAILSGVKVNMGTVGVDGDVPFAKNCTPYSHDRDLMTVLDYAAMQGKSVGIVTNTRITHATPGSAYGHTPWRDWESDTTMIGIPNCDHLKDLAYQLVMNNSNINVLLGGGRRNFLNNTTPDRRSGKIESQQRTDGLDLREVWKQDKMDKGKTHKYVETKGEFDAVDPENTEFLFGLFTPSHMSYEVDRKKTPDGEPSLVEMVDKAIRILRKNPNGFFLLVEGGRIDHAHHDNYGKKALVETDVFDEAVKKIGELTTTKDTLTIVTADHSHVFTVAGYPTRGNDILGTVDLIGEGEAPDDNLPYLTLGYTNGPKDGRTDLTGVDTTTDDFQQPGCIKMPYETHGGEDVSIYAQGPMAHLFHTTHEQTYIGHVMMYAACIGDYTDDCDWEMREMEAADEPCDAVKPMVSAVVLLLVAFLVVLFVE